MRISVTKACLCLAFLFPASALQSQEADDLPEPAGAVLRSGVFRKPDEPLPGTSDASRREVETSEAVLRQKWESEQRLANERQLQDLVTRRHAEQNWNNLQKNGFAPIGPRQPQFPQLSETHGDTVGKWNYPSNSNSELNQANQVANESISKLVQQIRSSKDSTKNEELKAEIKEHLSTQYDAYLDHHEKPLKQLEERLEKLREEFESRKKVKEDLVKLRLDTIWYDAIGLNWPRTNGPTNVFSGPSGPASASGFAFPTPRSMPTPPPNYYERN